MNFIRSFWTTGADEPSPPRRAYLRERDDHHGAQVGNTSRHAPAGHTNSRLELLGQLSAIIGLFVQLPEQIGQVLTYDDVFAWFVSARPAGETARRGAVLRSIRGSRRIEIVQIFLDAHNEPLRTPRGDVVGRRLVVTELDEELAETFGNDDLVIVE
jgi:hypothetical protein